MAKRAAPKAKRFAEGTEVTVDRSRAELEALLDKHGATEVLVHRGAQRSTLIYRLGGRMIRQVVTYPDAAAYERVDPKNKWSAKRKPEAVKRMQEAEWRRRWRAQLLILKAKLELIASGESTVDREFLADTMLPNGETVAEAMLPRIAQAYETGEMPPLMLGAGGAR
jgi:hypothetical protein